MGHLTFGKALRYLFCVVAAFGLLFPAYMYCMQTWFPPAGSAAGEWIGTLRLQKLTVGGSTEQNLAAPRIHNTAAIYLKLQPESSLTWRPERFKGSGKIQFGDSKEVRNFRVIFDLEVTQGNYVPHGGAHFIVSLVFEDGGSDPHIGDLMGTFMPGALTVEPEPDKSRSELDWSSMGTLQKGSIQDFDSLAPSTKT